MNDLLEDLGLTPLEVECTSTACDAAELHCFKPLKDSNGACRECGVELIDWELLHARDPAQIENVIESLQHEAIRAVYWNFEMIEHARRYALRKGLSGLREHVPRHLKNNLKPRSKNKKYDGRQTEMNSKNAIHWAQHATATCCRVCLSYWHGIDEDDVLDEEQLGYLTELIMNYFSIKMPDMGEDGVYQPPIRKKKTKNKKVQ